MSILRSRRDFPILKRKINGRPLVYFDNAATTQRPMAVIKSLDEFYTRHNANIHRGLHTLSLEATGLYEQAREMVQKFLNTQHPEEVIFTSGTTESINFIVQTFGRKFLKRGDEIILTEMEHHSNIVPWQILAQEKKLKLKYIPLLPNGRLNLAVYKKLFSKKSKIVSVTHASNVLGTINPIEQIVKIAHQHKTITIVDAAQSIPHLPVDVRRINCDFLAFSSHKVLGPTGVGVLYGKKHLLENLPPFQYGGSMVALVEKNSAVFSGLPHRLEAGTPPIAQAIGLGAALQYLQKIGMKNVYRYEKKLVAYGLKKLGQIPGLCLLGPSKARDRLAIFSFTFEKIPAHDIGTLLDEKGIAVRGGHHCALPVHRFYNVFASTRASLYFYNTIQEIDKLASNLIKIKKIFRKRPDLAKHNRKRISLTN